MPLRIVSWNTNKQEEAWRFLAADAIEGRVAQAGLHRVRPGGR
jgi:hypothetical protein